MQYKNISYLVGLLLFSLGLGAQNLLEVEFLVEYSEAEIETIFQVDAENGVALYKVLYLTQHPPENLKDTASGLLVLPDNMTPQVPIVVYQHGTSLDKEDVPSMQNGESRIPIIYAAAGYMAVTADYIGLGESDGFHPYVHADTEASAGLDMLIAAIEYLESLTSESWLGELYLCGYSQGGHASMALHRYLQENFSIIWPVTKAAHMSGPYSISGVMKDKILSDDEYLFTGYVPNTIMGYQEVYGDLYTSLSEIFKSNYVTPIQNYYNGQINLYDLSVQLGAILQVTTGSIVPKRMFQDAILNDIETNPDHPINLALADNDTYDWVPDCPTRLYYCMADDQVPFQNSVVASEHMNDLGAIDVKAIDLNSGFDHGECVAPAIAQSILFFKGLASSVDEDKARIDEMLKLYPNPGTEKVYIELPGEWRNPETDGLLQVHDMQGQLVWSSCITDREKVVIPVAGWTPGIYAVTGILGGKTYYQKLVRE